MLYEKMRVGEAPTSLRGASTQPAQRRRHHGGADSDRLGVGQQLGHGRSEQRRSLRVKSETADVSDRPLIW